MEIIAAIVVAGPAGYFARTRKFGLSLYLLVWAIVFPIQTLTAEVWANDNEPQLYWLFNAVILAAGVGLNQLGWIVRQRRRAHRVATVQGGDAR